MICYECQMQHPHHKMGCGSVSRMDTLQWLISSLQYLPDDILEVVYYKVSAEVQDRKYKEMFEEEE